MRPRLRCQRMAENLQHPKGCPLPIIIFILIFQRQRETGAHHLQTGVALPHQLMTWRAVFSAAKVATKFGDHAYGLPQQQRLG